MTKNKIAVAFIVTAAFFAGTVYVVGAYNIIPSFNIYYPKPDVAFWGLRSIDTMKYSRDLSREKLHDFSFDAIIDEQIKNIALVGATHVAIATPYDEEFLPILKRWVKAARKYGLNVWFRGNWSGWEGWFDYPAMSRQEHVMKTKNFILDNPELFENGDIFSGCPECENGGSGDPRSTGDVEGFRNFIIEEYKEAKSAMRGINKKVSTNYFSMNGDVARLIMDEKTTAELDDTVTVDHYVKTPEELQKDVGILAEESNGYIVLGEFGAPIPDIHGDFSEEDQAEWMDQALGLLKGLSNLRGINYWSAVGGSTAIWEDGGRARESVKILNKYFNPNAAYGTVRDELDRPIPNAEVSYAGRGVSVDEKGYFEFPYVRSENVSMKITATGFIEREMEPDLYNRQMNIVLTKADESVIFALAKYLKSIFNR